jgi:hypothetical protein
MIEKKGAGVRPGETNDLATPWFAILERARLLGDHDRAAAAQQELERLGVQVRFFRSGRQVSHRHRAQREDGRG